MPLSRANGRLAVALCVCEQPPVVTVDRPKGTGGGCAAHQRQVPPRLSGVGLLGTRARALTASFVSATVAAVRARTTTAITTVITSILTATTPWLHSHRCPRMSRGRASGRAPRHKRVQCGTGAICRTPVPLRASRSSAAPKAARRRPDVGVPAGAVTPTLDKWFVLMRSFDFEHSKRFRHPCKLRKLPTTRAQAKGRDGR